LDAIGDAHFITADAVKKIIYKKGAAKMNDVHYQQYFWQNDLVRVRRAKLEDWKLNFNDLINSPERFFVNYEQEMPWDENLYGLLADEFRTHNS